MERRYDEIKVSMYTESDSNNNSTRGRIDQEDLYVIDLKVSDRFTYINFELKARTMSRQSIYIRNEEDSHSTGTSSVKLIISLAWYRYSTFSVPCGAV